MNITNLVNITARFDSDLERNLAQVLSGLLSTGAWLRRWRIEADKTKDRSWDFSASGPIPGGGRGLLCVECKNLNFQPSQFQSIADRPCSPKGKALAVKILAMPRVSARMAELCQERGWSWFDLAGNCRVEIPDVLLIERSGKISSIAVASARTPANLGTPEAGRIVRALLAPENAGRQWTQREIVAEFAQVAPNIPAPSLALVNKVVQHLRAQAVMESAQKRGFTVRDHEGLLRMWRAAYRFDRHRRRQYFTLLKGRVLEDRLRAVDPDNQGRLAYAVFSAADRQAPTVRQPRTWLYLDPNAEAEFQSTVEAKIVESGENLVVLLPDDRAVFYRAEATDHQAACTNAVQTYVDLAHSGGRGEEAAEAILERRLKPAWSAAKR